MVWQFLEKKTSSWESMISVSYIIHTITVDGLAMQGAWASAAMVLFHYPVLSTRRIKIFQWRFYDNSSHCHIWISFKLFLQQRVTQKLESGLSTTYYVITSSETNQISGQSYNRNLEIMHEIGIHFFLNMKSVYLKTKQIQLLNI